MKTKYYLSPNKPWVVVNKIKIKPISLSHVLREKRRRKLNIASLKQDLFIAIMLLNNLSN
jgi:hypothetical protein